MLKNIYYKVDSCSLKLTCTSAKWKKVDSYLNVFIATADKDFIKSIQHKPVTIKIFYYTNEGIFYHLLKNCTYQKHDNTTVFLKVNKVEYISPQ